MSTNLVLEKRPFSKPAKSFPEKVALLKERGLAFGDEAVAAKRLSEIGYYRLRGYWLAYEADCTTHCFKSGAHFNDVLRDYDFDRELRVLLFAAIERFEVAFRAQWAASLAAHEGAHAHLNAALFRSDNHWDHQTAVAKLRVECDRSKESFIRHFDGRYKESLPPIWVVTEVISFGALCKWYRATGPRRFRNEIARHFGLSGETLSGILGNLTYIRNLCAHHSRLWDRRFHTKPKLPKRGDARLTHSLNRIVTDRLYNTLVILACMTARLEGGDSLAQRIKDLTETYDVDTSRMGFPPDYLDRPLWM